MPPWRPAVSKRWVETEKEEELKAEENDMRSKIKRVTGY
jgi:hypothetical protein